VNKFIINFFNYRTIRNKIWTLTFLKHLGAPSGLLMASVLLIFLFFCVFCFARLSSVNCTQYLPVSLDCLFLICPIICLNVYVCNRQYLLPVKKKPRKGVFWISCTFHKISKKKKKGIRNYFLKYNWQFEITSLFHFWYT
jgi:hypothetical protein